MQIKQATAADEARIKEFSAAEWPAADLEHFGTAEVDFKRQNLPSLRKLMVNWQDILPWKPTWVSAKLIQSLPAKPIAVRALENY